MEEIKKFRKIEYEFRGKKGTVLVEDTIKKEQEIKEICLKDVLEKISNEIKIIGEDK